MGKKTCLLTTFVAGKRYQAFIPMLVYSCKKAYPEYDILLFLYEELQLDIKQSLIKANLYDKVRIIENVFRNECPKITRLQAQSFRWVLWDDSFYDYKYLYIIDVDMFYIREPMMLHQQHALRMQETGLPFDNMRRRNYLHRSVKGFVYRIKNAGFKNLTRYLFEKNVVEERLTGLHFVEVDKYYTNDNLCILKEIKERLLKRYFFPEILTCNDEVLLANIVKKMGCDISKVGVQTDSIQSLPFENIYRDEFRPHHGFHLGMLKNVDYEHFNSFQSQMFTPILESETYKYYLSVYLQIIKEKDFELLYNNLPSLAKIYINRLNTYYKIDFHEKETQIEA